MTAAAADEGPTVPGAIALLVSGFAASTAAGLGLDDAEAETEVGVGV